MYLRVSQAIASGVAQPIVSTMPMESGGDSSMMPRSKESRSASLALVES